MVALLLVLLVAESGAGPFTSPKSTSAEYGYGLSKDEALGGWVAIFDGESTFGWKDATVESQTLSGGQTSSVFGSCELKGEVATGGMLSVGDVTFSVAPGKFERRLNVKEPGPIVLGSGLAVQDLQLKPVGLKSVFNGRDLSGWSILRHPTLADARQTKWSVEEGVLRGAGGPGAVELDGEFADLVLQVEVRTRAKLVNGGVFFRSVPGEFMNGYEAQIFNACYGEDAGRPARYSTGGIDDRQLARRLVSRDLEPFMMTVVASGPHMATWVNGYQMTDWTDMRPAHKNPREGLRIKKGTIQLQAHDPETDIEFRRIVVAEIE